MGLIFKEMPLPLGGPSYLPASFEIPILDMAIAHSDEVAAIFGEAHGSHFGADFIRGHLKVGPPVEHIDDHVVLGAHRYQVLARGRKGLQLVDN